MAKRREDSFFGMHFDFHAQKNQTGIGSNCAPEVIGKLLDAVKPDYVQCDTKGHAGATSYPTKVGNPAEGMVGDILRMWREETEKRGVGLYAHHSGVWDNLAVEKHPDWAAWDENGNPSDQKISVFGPYCDELLAPQLIEMATEYGLDGAWVDGECWAVMPDYSPWAKAAYAEKYGKEPPKRGEEGYDEFLEFNRQGFRDYVTRYIRAVKAKAPNFQVASNWIEQCLEHALPLRTQVSQPARSLKRATRVVAAFGMHTLYICFIATCATNSYTVETAAQVAALRAVHCW